MRYGTASVAGKTGVAGMPATVALGLVLGLAVGSQAGRAQETAPAGTPPGSQPVPLMFSPWARYCAKDLKGKSSEMTAREVCFTAADGHLATGQKLAIALLIEPQGSDTKLLRVTLPLGVALVPGARIVIDDNEAMTAPFVVCLPKNGCMADLKADGDLIDKLKRGQSLAIQAFDKGKPVSFTLPLTGFAKAYDGPPGDPTGLNELQERLPN